MATLQQLEAAFIAADDAGNEEDARAFAQEIVRLRGQSNPAKQYQAGLEAAFIAADDAGNEEDARAFAQEIVRLRGQSNPAKQYQAGLEAAFIAADDAGNEEDARAFAQEIVRLRGQSNPAKQYQAGPVPKVTQPSFLNEMVQGPLQELGQGATFGTLDELEGGIAALTGGNYGDTVAARR